MKKFLISALAFLWAVICLLAGNYKLTVKLAPDMVGSMAYIVNYDTGQNVDSVLVDEGIAEFKGNVDDPFLARLIVDGKRSGQFIVENGEIEIIPAESKVSGGTLNTISSNYQNQAKQLAQQYQSTTDENSRKEILSQYNALSDKIFNENLENPIGYSIFLEKAYEMSPDALEKYVAEHPYFAKFSRVNKLIESNRRKLATSEGAKFADFEIEYAETKHKLSDVVGKGDYVLVDFWASWCGPCIRQTKVLKELYNEYKDSGLKILGVAVWDEPENTKKAIVQHELPWESWLNGQNIPTDIYGISGIPCIILFGPDGTILSRDKQDDELKNAVANALKK